MARKPKIIALVGPTATGKSSLAVELALKYDGEIISADSRQVYTGLDIATSKITEEEMCGIPHHMLSVISPQKRLSVAEYKKYAERALEDILVRDKLPIICGGSGLYINALVFGEVYPEVAPNESLRKELEKKEIDDLLSLLAYKAPERAQTIDQQNKRRIIRALEIHEALGHVPKRKTEHPYDSLMIGLDLPDEKLKENIRKRTVERMEVGMIHEVKKLEQEGLPQERLAELGLEYRILAKGLEQNLSEDEMTRQIEQADWKYAKRQRTWFKKNKDIHWFHPEKQNEILSEVDAFLTKNND